MEDNLCELDRPRGGYKLIFPLKKNVERSAAKGIPDLNSLFIYNMPVRALCKMAGNFVSMEMSEAVLMMANGHFFRGFGRFLGGFFRNRRENRKYEKLLASCK